MCSGEIRLHRFAFSPGEGYKVTVITREKDEIKFGNWRNDVYIVIYHRLKRDGYMESWLRPLYKSIRLNFLDIEDLELPSAHAPILLCAFAVNTIEDFLTFLPRLSYLQTQLEEEIVLLLTEDDEDLRELTIKALDDSSHARAMTPLVRDGGIRGHFDPKTTIKLSIRAASS